MAKKVKVLGVCSYGHGLNTATGRLYNRLILDWILAHENEFDFFLFVGSWVYRDPSRKPICVWQREQLIKKGASPEKIHTLVDSDPTVMMAMDTIQELWAMGLILQGLEYYPCDVTLDVVGMSYHKKRILACVNHIGAIVGQIHEVESGGNQQSKAAYGMSYLHGWGFFLQRRVKDQFWIWRASIGY